MFSPGVEPASLGDYVWHDVNENGVQDADEEPVSDVIVRLVNPATGVTIASAVTDDNGYYAFTGLAPGEYAVSFVLPSGYTFTSADAGADDGLDSDANVSTGRTQAVTLAAGEHNPTLDAGIYLDEDILASLGDYVWLDIDQDGNWEEGEPGIGGVTIHLIDPGTGNTIATTVTDPSGGYRFDGLVPGNYVLIFEPPPGYAFTLPNQGDDHTTDSDVDPVTGQTGVIPVLPGHHVPDIDVGVYPIDFQEFPDLGNTSKTAVDINGGDLMPGDIIQYSVVIYNAGNGDATGVVYTDTMNPYTQLLADSIETDRGQVDVVDPSAVFRVDIGTIWPFESVTIRYQVQLDEDAPYCIWIDNQGRVTSGLTPEEPTDDPSSGSLNDPTLVGPVGGITGAASLDAVKTVIDVDGGELLPGDIIEFRIEVTNGGTEVAKHLVQTDGIPLHTDLIPGSLTTDRGMAFETNPLTIQSGDLQPGETTMVTFQVVVDEDALPNTNIVNQGRITAECGLVALTDDPTIPGPEDPTGIYVTGGKPDLEVYKAVRDLNGGRVNADDLLQYTVTLVNMGTAAVERVIFHDHPYGYVRLIPKTVGNSAGTVVRGNSDSDHTVEIDLDRLPPNETVTITYQVEVLPGVPTGARISNQGLAYIGGWPIFSGGDLSAEPTDDPSTVADDDPTVIVAEGCATAPPIRAYKTVTGDRPVIRWEMRWINDGDEPIRLEIEDPVPEGTTYLDGTLGADYGTVGYDPDSDLIVWDGEIPPDGAELKIWFETRVADATVLTENQACALWDRSAHFGDADDCLVRICTDDPNTPEPDDPTVWTAAPCPMSLGDFVWTDACEGYPRDISNAPGSGNRMLETAVGVNGVKVDLFRDSNRSGDFTPGVDEYLRSTTTGNKDYGEGDERPGYYRFDTLCEGEYILRIDPANFAEGGPLAKTMSVPGSPDPDDDVNGDDNGSPLTDIGVVSRAVTLIPGTEPVDDGDDDANTNLTVDFGFCRESAPDPECPGCRPMKPF